mgnify:FL=1
MKHCWKKCNSEKPLSVQYIHVVWVIYGVDHIYTCSCHRYCYLLNDLTKEQLIQKATDFDSLREYLRLEGREAYLKKRVGFIYQINNI